MGPIQKAWNPRQFICHPYSETCERERGNHSRSNQISLFWPSKCSLRIKLSLDKAFLFCSFKKEERKVLIIFSFFMNNKNG